MKKKKLSFLIALAMIVSVATPAFATPPSPPAIELIATSTSPNNVVNATQGTTVDFNITLSLQDYTGIDAKVKVDTRYSIDQYGQPSSNTPSNLKIFNNGSLTFPVSVTVNQSYSSGDVIVPIAIQVVKNGNSSVGVVNEIIDYFTVHVAQADTTAPVVTIKSPINNGYYNATTLPSQPVYNVVEEHIDTTQVDGWSTDEGTHTVTVTATDASKNVGSASAIYTVDTTPPSIETALVDGGIYNASTLQNMLGAGGDKYYIVQDANLDPSTVSASDLVYTDGEYTATITAKDKAGNTTTKTIKYTVDNTAPSISFNFNDGGFYQSKFTGFNPYYNVKDEHLDTNSVSASTLDLAEGNHSVTVSALDLAGNKNSASASYTVDDIAPTVTIKLDPSKFYNKASLDALGDYYTAEDTNLLNVSASTLEKEKDGAYAATVSATDKAGNNTTQNVSYSVDNTSPVITLNEKLKNGGFYKTVDLEDIKDKFFTAEDAHLVNATASNSELNLTEGQHTISVTAVDAANNVTVENIIYTIDNMPPEVDFNIADGSFLTTDNLNKALNGKDYYTTSDNIGVVSVVADGLKTSEGTHTLSVTAKDAAGNETTKSITYTVDNTPPTINAPADVTKEATGVLTPVNLGSATASDNVSSGDDLTISNNAPKEGFPVGTTTVTWTVTDKAGNQTTTTQTVKVQDTTAPTFTFIPKDIVTTTTGTSTKVDIGTATANDIFGATVTNDAPDTFSVGTTIVNWTAKDPSGNIAIATQKVTVYQFSGVLQPVNAIATNQNLSAVKVSQYKINSTVPVKFTLTDKNGFVNPLTATLSIKKSSSELSADFELETAVSTSASTTDNLFRYDSISGQYIFNMSSKGFLPGMYVIRITLSNGQYYDYFISFK